MELQAAPAKVQSNTAPIYSITEQTAKSHRGEVKLLLKKNREIFNYHVARLTKLQQLIVAEEAIISDCLDKEKLLMDSIE